MRPSSIALVWLGIVVGVSFLATPIKFAAPSLDLPTALEVGRVTFRLLARVEWILAAALAVAAWRCGVRPAWSVWLTIAILVLEAAWLMPALGVRTDAIRAGVAVPPSQLHTLFIAAELTKCIALAHAAVVMHQLELHSVACGSQGAAFDRTAARNRGGTGSTSPTARR